MHRSQVPLVYVLLFSFFQDRSLHLNLGKLELFHVRRIERSNILTNKCSRYLPMPKAKQELISYKAPSKIALVAFRDSSSVYD